jgi:HD superfamily phosphodiesterase
MNDSNKLDALETALRNRVRLEEAEHGRNDKPSDSLWDHLERVARIAEHLGRAEGVKPLACRLAGLFHDAGKFGGGSYHKGDKPEEERSVEALRELAQKQKIEKDLIDPVEESILQLYREDPDPTHLTRVLFDADNLDKLGPLGIGNYFVKAGLRGGGISPNFLYRVTVELTYARHAPRCLATESGRKIARKRAPETSKFLREFLDTLREDGLYDFRVEEVVFDNLALDVVAPTSCECGGKLIRKIWEIPGIKCSEIHLKHSCQTCNASHELRFCRPRLII